MSTDPWGAPASQSNDPWGGVGSSDPWGAPAQPPAQSAPPAAAEQPPSADEFFQNSGLGKAFSFDVPSPPLRLGGQITELPALRRKTDQVTGEYKNFKDGSPRWVMPVLCQTDMREDADDDGVRAHFLEYKKLKAVQEAVKRAGKTMPEVGGHLFITYLAPAPPKGQAKNYSAEYYPPGTTPPAAPSQPAAAQSGWGSPPQSAAAPPAHPGSIAMAAGASRELAEALVAMGMTAEEAGRLGGLASGWQGAQAGQIMPYIKTPTSEPPF